MVAITQKKVSDVATPHGVRADQAEIQPNPEISLANTNSVEKLGLNHTVHAWP